MCSTGTAAAAAATAAAVKADVGVVVRSLLRGTDVAVTSSSSTAVLISTLRLRTLLSMWSRLSVSCRFFLRSCGGLLSLLLLSGTGTAAAAAAGTTATSAITGTVAPTGAAAA
eukprot:18984-Heterococcus_DN1.PRE.1